MDGYGDALNFRPATTDDVPFITGLLRDFYNQAGGIYQIPWDSESAMLTVAEVLVRGICLVGPTSCAGAVIAGFEYNHHARVANVVFWKFKSAREIRILEALKQACKAAGATHISVSSHFPKNTIARFYKKQGFTFCEVKSLLPI